MKRFCAFILCLPVLFVLAVAEIEVERVAKHPDLFYMEHIGEAVTASESTSFDIGYRVSSAKEQPEPGKEDGMEFYALQYDLYIGNGTGQELENITITAHLRELPQTVFLFRHWYNEPQDLSAGEGSDVPCKALYTWNPFVVLEVCRSAKRYRRQTFPIC